MLASIFASVFYTNWFNRFDHLMQFSIVPYLPQVAFVDIELFVDSANLSALKIKQRFYILLHTNISNSNFLREAVTSLRQFIRSKACGGGWSVEYCRLSYSGCFMVVMMILITSWNDDFGYKSC